MEWLTMVSVIGLIIAVLVLGTVIVQPIWTRRQQDQPKEERASHERLDVSIGDSKEVNVTVPRPTASPIGFRNPRLAFRNAFMNGDTQSAAAVLPDLERQLGAENPEYLMAASTLASVGEEVGVLPLLKVIESNDVSDVSDDTVRKFIFASAVQYYIFNDREQDGLEKMEGVLERQVHDKSRPDEFRASIANQLGMLYFGVGRMTNALETIELATRLAPNEPSYYFNLSLIYEKCDDLVKAIEAIEYCLEISTNAPDRDHHFQAWDLYRQTGDQKKANEMLAKISS